MKVYVIERGEYSDRHIVGVVDSEERAKRIVELIYREDYPHNVVGYKQFEVNDVDCVTEDYLQRFLVVIKDDKTFKCELYDRKENEWWNFKWKCYDGFREEVNVFQEIQRYQGEDMGVIVEAEDDAHALKIAQDLYAEYLAEQDGVKL